MDIGVNPDFDFLLDPQQSKPYGYCIYCNREIYRPFTDICDACTMDVEADDDDE